MSYDTALVTFSPDGHLFQVEYALKAVSQGSAVVGIRGKDCVVLGVERRVLAKLQDQRSMKKIVKLDDGIVVGFAGLTADARVLIDRARVQCQSYRLTMEDAPSPEFVARWLAKLQQRYTQRGGVRPFGVTALIAGFDPTSGEPRLYKTDPSGIYTAWRAATCGKNDSDVLELLEKKMGGEGEGDEGEDGGFVVVDTEDAAVELCVEALSEVVDATEPDNVEILVLRRDSGKKLEFLTDEQVKVVADAVKARKDAEAEAARGRGAD